MDENNNQGEYQNGYDWQKPVPPVEQPPAAVEPVPDPPPPQPFYPYQQNNYWQALPPHGYAPPEAPPPKRRRSGAAAIVAVASVLVVVGLFIGAGIYRDAHTPKPDNGGAQITQDDSRLEMAETPKGDKSLPEMPGGLSPVAIHEKTRDANVAVQLYGRSESVVGEGSGILIHEDASHTYTYVVTCAHVISGNQRVSVELEDGTTYNADIVGFDSKTDVGLLRIKATGLNGAEFGDSDQLQVGEPVYAIGNPGGIDFKGSFTGGMVSAIDRAITSKYKMKTIQHTAAINPGNSGGALLNALGQVVGINSQKIVDTEYEGMGFAIPSKTVLEVVNNLIEKGYVPNRPKLGIQYVAARETQAGYYIVRANDLPSGSLIIAKIDEGSNIAGTDVRANDIITHVNGKPLNKADVLLQAVENGKVGDSLKLTIARVNPSNYSVDTFDITVKLIEDKGKSETVEETQPWWHDQFGNDPFSNFPW